MSSFQNGDIRLYQAISKVRHLGDFPRFSGCVLPHYDSQEVSSVSLIYLRQESLSVSSSTIWSKSSVLRHIRLLGIRVHAYLDDCLLPSVSERLAWKHNKEVREIIPRLSFIHNWDKSDLVPFQIFSFLGARFDLVFGLVGPSLDRLVKL